MKNISLFFSITIIFLSVNGNAKEMYRCKDGMNVTMTYEPGRYRDRGETCITQDSHEQIEELKQMLYYESGMRNHEQILARERSYQGPTRQKSNQKPVRVEEDSNNVDRSSNTRKIPSNLDADKIEKLYASLSKAKTAKVTSDSLLEKNRHLVEMGLDGMGIEELKREEKLNRRLQEIIETIEEKLYY